MNEIDELASESINESINEAINESIDKSGHDIDFGCYIAHLQHFAIRSSSVATTTLSSFVAFMAWSQVLTIIGFPAISTSGLPGNLEDLYLAGITPTCPGPVHRNQPMDDLLICGVIGLFHTSLKCMVGMISNWDPKGDLRVIVLDG
eukprot:scaffold588926_cov41-Prasinocladus_malaysianus.AAC.1